MVKRYCNLLNNSMSCRVKPAVVHTATQTVIKVYPHVLEPQQYARVSSDKKMQTEVSIKPDAKTEIFYSLLRFTPYQDIQENCVRVIELPRKVRLKFNPGVEFDKMAQVARYFSLTDDDGVGYICCELIHRLERRHKRYYVDVGIQTDLNVYPHLLKDDHIATIKNNATLQTDKRDSSTSLPTESNFFGHQLDNGSHTTMITLLPDTATATVATMTTTTAMAASAITEEEEEVDDNTNLDS